MKEDHRSYLTQLLQLRKEILKKIQACTRFEPLAFAIPVQRSTNSARALHRYRRGQGFESRTSLNFVRIFSQLQKLRL